ncbi:MULTISPECIES: DUF445 domain-containing protein [Clostridium]|uniref:DUF445 domain-containing protein n=1 Tax=Clostridium TaxID=1485 RepID=UPI000825DD2F|nr:MULTISPECIES: DUF445 family protein [Clostridium]PJI07151.1 DUF445 domain-containing protein [Clostridium sp. CT7]
MNYRNKANITLVMVSVGFIIAFIIKYYVLNNAYSDFLFTIMEAGLVGGVADWFAITALYRKPLGVSFHTALIPRNREKIIDATASFVEKELLSSESIKQKIEKNNIGDKLIENIIKNEKSICLKAFSLIDEYVNKIDKNKIKEEIKKLREKYLNELYSSSRIKCIAECIYTNNKEKILNVISDFLLYVLKKPEVEDYIYNFADKVKKENTKGTFAKIGLSIFEASDSVNTREACKIFYEELIHKVKGLSEPQNYYRNEIDKCIMRFLDRLDSSDGNLEVIKENIFGDDSIEKIMNKLFLKSKIQFEENELYGCFISEKLFGIFVNCFKKLKDDRKSLSKIEDYVQKTVINLLQEKHYVIGKFIRDTLNEFDDKRLNEFIDDKVGSDLQWIRINGSVVGGFAGMILFFIMKFIYNPFISPAIRGLFLR